MLNVTVRIVATGPNVLEPILMYLRKVPHYTVKCKLSTSQTSQVPYKHLHLHQLHLHCVQPSAPTAVYTDTVFGASSVTDVELSKISTSFPPVPAFPLNLRHKRKARYRTWRQQVPHQWRYISSSFHSFIFQATLIPYSEIYIKVWCKAVETLVRRRLRFFPHAIKRHAAKTQGGVQVQLRVCLRDQ